MLTYPQRLFLHNLFVCANIDSGEIEIKINDATCEKIQDTIKTLLENEKIENRSEVSVLTPSFIKFVNSSCDEVEKRKQHSPNDKNVKGKDYYLFECYKSILEVTNHLLRNDRLKKMNAKDYEMIKNLDLMLHIFSMILSCLLLAIRRLRDFFV